MLFSPEASGLCWVQQLVVISNLCQAAQFAQKALEPFTSPQPFLNFAKQATISSQFGQEQAAFDQVAIEFERFLSFGNQAYLVNGSSVIAFTSSFTSAKPPYSPQLIEHQVGCAGCKECCQPSVAASFAGVSTTIASGYTAGDESFVESLSFK